MVARTRVLPGFSDTFAYPAGLLTGNGGWFDDPGDPVGLSVNSPGDVFIATLPLGGNLHTVAGWDTTAPWRISIGFTVPPVPTDASSANLQLEEPDGSTSGVGFGASVDAGSPGTITLASATSSVSTPCTFGAPHVATLTFDGTTQTMALDGVPFSSDPISVPLLVTPCIGLQIVANDTTGIRVNSVQVEIL